jgi:hypothetical protein
MEGKHADKKIKITVPYEYTLKAFLQTPPKRKKKPARKKGK